MTDEPTDRLAGLVASARASGDIARLVDAIPYSRFMGISMVHVAGELLGALRFGEHLIGNPMLPAIHGGVLAALLESTAIFQLMWETEAIVLPKTITLTVDYLRPGRAQDTWARGILTRQGRRVANVRVEAWQDDRSRPIAVASAHLLLKLHSPSGPEKSPAPQDG